MRASRWLAAGGIFVLLLSVSPLSVSAALPPGGAGPDCSQVKALGYDRQTNAHAAQIMVDCGLAQPAAPEGLQADNAGAAVAPALGGTDRQVNNALADVYPHVTQSESFVAVNGSTVVVNYNSSSAAPANYSGVSYSTDGGTTFTEIRPSPFAVGHGTNFGDPIIWYNQHLGRFYAGDLVTGCGGQGIGLWTSVDGISWSVGACAHNGGSDDRESMWTDNTPSSPHYGRMYISWNNFLVGGGALQVVYSDDGTTWSAPVTVLGTFIRNVQLTGGPDGTVFLATMDEGGGGLNPRHNYIYRSTDGGATWTSFSAGPTFPAPGTGLCSNNPYFAIIAPIWRHMGWGQPGVGPNGVVHYVYTAHGAGTDAGDIVYLRSTDNGATWLPPVRLNTDATTRTQWMPSLAVTAGGRVVVGWYDRRYTPYNVYVYVARVSTDNGATWGPDRPVSDQLILQPRQPDPNVQTCYAGDYMYDIAAGDTVYMTWTDGRVKINNTPQQDVYFDKITP